MLSTGTYFLERTKSLKSSASAYIYKGLSMQKRIDQLIFTFGVEAPHLGTISSNVAVDPYRVNFLKAVQLFR